MYSIDEIIEELLIYEKKWYYKEYKRFYKSEKDFKRAHKRIIKQNPTQLYRYVTYKFDETIKFDNLKNNKVTERLYEATTLLIKIGIFLKEHNLKII